MRIKLVNLLTCLAEHEGQEAVVKAVRSAIGQRRLDTHPGMDLDTFLNFYRAKGLLNAGVEYKGWKLKDAVRLSQALRRLKITPAMIISSETRFSPWDSFEPDSVVAVLLGGKFAEPDRPTGLRTRVMGVRDGEALARLIAVLHEAAEIVFRVELHLHPPDLAPADAREALEKLLHRQDVGAIVALGSPLVNPLTDPITRLMFDGRPASDLPARFRGAFDLDRPDPFLSEPLRCASGREGITLRGHERTTLPRVRDEEIMEKVKRTTRGTFPDCGILAMSDHLPKLLLVCAGHGGSATKAAVLGLANVAYVERKLMESYEPDAAVGPPGRVFEPLWVKRKKRTRDPVDDLVFDEHYGKGWGFLWDEELR